MVLLHRRNLLKRVLFLMLLCLALGTPRATVAPQRGYRSGDLELLARLISGEARGEPYLGQVAVGAVVINRVESPNFPNTVSEVIFQPGAFESVSNGQIWAEPPSDTQYSAAQAALDGVDPTYGALYFWNPNLPVNPWIWTRTITLWIGKHVFGI
ncbi:MAG: cell wall hydrolase [Bacillota bacterium]